MPERGTAIWARGTPCAAAKPMVADLFSDAWGAGRRDGAAHWIPLSKLNGLL
jgi:hypothetical protein